MHDLPEFRIYLSSTVDDLTEERAAAAGIIARHGLLRDSYRASEQGSVATCTGDVRAAHLYVGILGKRYGWVPDGADKPDARSITELEYEACWTEGQPRIPRLMFIRTTSPDRFTDSDIRPQTAERIGAFRERAGRDQQPYNFDTIEQLRVALTDALKLARDEFHRKRGAGVAIFDPRRTWNAALRPVVLFSIPGNDESLCRTLRDLRPELFTTAELSPNVGALAVQVDRGVREGQWPCLAVSATSLQRLAEAGVAERFRFALETLRQRAGQLFVLCLGIDPAQLPQGWPEHVPVRVDQAHDPAILAEELHVALRQHVLLTSSPQLMFPCMIVAPTRVELDTLETTSAFDGFVDEDVREQRRREFDRLREAARRANRAWPTQCYGDQRSQWRCFGPGKDTAESLVNKAVAAINTAVSGSRERSLLHDANVLVRFYAFDEYLEDHFGSREVIAALVERGGLVIVDELALFHPRLRQAADELLRTSRSAVVSISPSDPLHEPTSRLLGDLSFLRVGSIVERFKLQHDPQCELTLNCDERLVRWLRHAIPRLVVERDGSGALPRLSARADELFAPAGGAR